MKTVLLALLSLILCTVASAAEFSGIVAFGDSLSDMGNRWIKSPADASKMRGTWVKRLAGPTMLKVDNFMVSGMTSYLGGTNYAVGGATTEYSATRNAARNADQNLTQQVSKRYLNPAFNTDGVKKDALHVIVIGSNDLMLCSVGFDQIGEQWANFDKVGVDVARSTEGQIQALASAGVKRVLWGNLFDAAQAPSIVARAKKLGGALAPTYFAALTKATLAHNAEMDLAIDRLEKANPGLKIIKLDLFAKFVDIAAHPSKYGFTDITTGANDDKHLFSADGLHPTPQGHKLLAEYAYSVITGEKLN